MHIGTCRPAFAGYQVRFQEEKLRPHYDQAVIDQWKKEIHAVIADNQDILASAPFSSDERDVVFLFGPDGIPKAGKTDLDGLLNNTHWVSYARHKQGGFSHCNNRLFNEGIKHSLFTKLDFALKDFTIWPSKKNLKALFQVGKASYNTTVNRLARTFRSTLLSEYSLFKHGLSFLKSKEPTPEQVQATLASRARTEAHFGIQPEWFDSPQPPHES